MCGSDSTQYELIRFSDSIRKLRMLVLESTRISVSSSKQTAWISGRSTMERLEGILETVNFYEVKVSSEGAKTAKDALKIVAREIDSAGLYCAKPTLGSEPPYVLDSELGALITDQLISDVTENVLRTRLVFFVMDVVIYWHLCLERRHLCPFHTPLNAWKT